MSAFSKQEGGKHYKDMAIQPFTYITKNGIGFAEGCVIKYVSRWKSKGGVEDLKKARHFLDMLIEMEAKDKYQCQYCYSREREHDCPYIKT
jgi:hypothetical protein